MENVMFAERIKELRSLSGFNQKDFAQKSGITAATLSAYESGAKSPSLSTADKIAREFNISIDWLCGLTNNRTHGDSPVTYSDIIAQLVSLEKNMWSDVYSVSREGKRKKVIDLRDSIMQYFLTDWEGMLTLRHNKTINEKLYDLWVADKLKEFAFRLDSEDDRDIFLQERNEQEARGGRE